MKKFLIAGAALVALAVPAVASADAPDGSNTFNPGSGITTMDKAAASKTAAQANGRQPHRLGVVRDHAQRPVHLGQGQRHAGLAAPEEQPFRPGAGRARSHGSRQRQVAG